MKNLYILTEERPKISVLATILQKFSTDQKAPCFIDNLRILPILEKDTFSFTYELIGFRSNIVNKVFIRHFQLCRFSHLLSTKHTHPYRYPPLRHRRNQNRRQRKP